MKYNLLYLYTIYTILNIKGTVLNCFQENNQEDMKIYIGFGINNNPQYIVCIN